MEQKSIVYFFQVQVYYHEGAVAIFKLTYLQKSVKIDLMTMWYSFSIQRSPKYIKVTF